MTAVLKQLRWQFLILQRNNLIAISILVTLLYAAIFYFIRDLPNVEPFLTLLIYNDPAIIGMFFVGLSIIMEKNDNLLPALFVTPVNYHNYLISRILALSILGLACAAGMTLMMLGPHISWFHFSMGVFSTCVIFSIAGIFIVSFATEFLNFLLRCIPLMFLLSLPLFNYFGLTDVWVFKLSPIQGALDLMIFSFQGLQDTLKIALAYLSVFIWIPILYLVVYRIFVNRVIKQVN